MQDSFFRKEFFLLTYKHESQHFFLIIFGVWLWIGYEIGFEKEFNWMHIKLLIVILLITYHLYCGKILRDFTNFKCKNSHIWFRIFNEIPVFLLFFTIYLVIFKPL